MGANACTLINQELPNEAPVLQASQVDTVRVSRGGRVALRVQASDEDDDPLDYAWSSFGAGDFAGDFLDPTTATTTWIAPSQIQGSSEFFLLVVTISDRQPDTEDVTETFGIEVTQRAPTLAVTTTDTAVSFQTSAVVIEAVAEDADGDPLTFGWELVEGEGLQLQIESPKSGRSSATLVALVPGDYLVAAKTSDGADTTTVQIRVRVEEPLTPDPTVGG